MATKYYIEALTTVHEDNYEQGELDYIQEYMTEDIETAETEKQAVHNFVNKHLYQSIDHYEPLAYEYNILVDKDNIQLTPTEIKKWREGDMIAYNSHTQLRVYKMIETEGSEDARDY